MATVGTKRDIEHVDGREHAEPPSRKSRMEENDGTTRYRLSFPTYIPGESVAFQYPSQLIAFSYTPDRVLEFNNSALRYYVDPPRNADLSYAYDKWIKRPEERGRLDGLLTALLREEATLDRKKADVVSWRGVMTK